MRDLSKMEERQPEDDRIRKFESSHKRIAKDVLFQQNFTTLALLFRKDEYEGQKYKTITGSVAVNSCISVINSLSG
jgi:hypothetical protein